MRRLLVLSLLVVLAGCGGGGEKEGVQQAPPLPKGDFGPVKPGSGERARPAAPPKRSPSATVAAALDAGTVGVVGINGAIGVRPATLDVSSDGRLEQLRWSGWGASKAKGTGKLRVLDCDPTCAGSGVKELNATIELSEPRLCGRATYFDRAVVSVGGESPPATYVRAPC